MEKTVYCYRFHIYSTFIQLSEIDVANFGKSNSDYDIAVIRESEDRHRGHYTFCIRNGNQEVDSITIGRFQFKDIQLWFDDFESWITTLVYDHLDDNASITVAKGNNGFNLIFEGFKGIIYKALMEMNNIANTYDSLYMYRICKQSDIDTIPKNLNEYISKHQAFLELISKAKEVKELLIKDETRDRDQKAYRDILMPIVQKFNDALSKFKFDVKELEL